MAAVRTPLARRAWVVARVAIAALLVAFSVRTIRAHDLGEAVRAIGVGRFAASVGLTVLSVVIAAARWQRVLAWAGARVPIRSVAADLLVGAAYNLLLPTSVGGDVVRATRATARTGAAGVGTASVVFERVIGLCTLALTAAVGVAIGGGPGSGALSTIALGLAATMVALALFLERPLALAASFIAPRSPPDRAWARALRERVAGGLRGIGQALGGPYARAGARLETVTWSIAYQFVSLSLLAVVAAGFPDPARGVLAVYVGVPMVLVLASLPISIGGFGLRESLFVAVLVPLGVSSERSLLLSLLWVASSLLTALAGAAVLVLESLPSHPGPSTAERVAKEERIS